MKLRVLTYNIHKGFSLFDRDFTLHEIKDSLRETKADVVLLQEVVGENILHQKKHANWPSEAQFEFLADSVWPHHSYGKNAVFDHSHHGNAILSRFPILMEENINISNNRWEQRGLLHVEIDLKAEAPEIQKNLHIFNVHLDLSEKGRKKQNTKIIERIETLIPEDLPFLLVGDFNDWNQALHKQLLTEAYLQESHEMIHKEPAKSFPSFFPTLPLDRLYYRNLKVLHCEALEKARWAKLSDHLPLLVEFDTDLA